MKRALALLLALSACFAMFSPVAMAESSEGKYYLEKVEVTSNNNSIQPFGYDEREVRLNENYNIRSTATHQIVDTLHLTVVGLVSNVYNTASIVSVYATFSNNLFVVNSTDYRGSLAVIEISDATHPSSIYLTVFARIVPNGTITTEYYT